MKNKALGIIYIHSPHNCVFDAKGNRLDIKKYQNGGKYVMDGKNQISYGKIPELTEEEINSFAEVFC